MPAMPPDDEAAVTRLYERLTEALQRTRREPFNVPVTVAEIFQELVPYRLVPAEVAEEIRRELRSANPNLSIYRNYATCDVWVREPPARTDEKRNDVAAP